MSFVDFMQTAATAVGWVFITLVGLGLFAGMCAIWMVFGYTALFGLRWDIKERLRKRRNKRRAVKAWQIEQERKRREGRDTEGGW